MRLSFGEAGFFAGFVAEWITFATTSAELTAGIRGSLVVAVEGKWLGVAYAVVGKSARDHGRKKRVSYINTDQRDLLPVVCLLAGVLGRFTESNSWCLLVNKKN